MPPTTTESAPYFPDPEGGDWQRVTPSEAGFDAGKLRAAVDFARASDSPWPPSLYYDDGRYVGIVEWNETGPWSEVAGPVAARGGPSGLVLKAGRIVAEWGDTGREDMTFSVAKSYLAVLAGLAVADGLIAAVDEPVGASVDGPWFASPHNQAISWRHLLQQTSEWQGELWGKSDQVDHHRQIGVGADNSRKGQRRQLQPPGSHFEYNDVRVNLLAFCLLKRFGRPLPEVLRERIMDPIGASASWQWHGYTTSWTEVGGRRLQSVSGGSHWGGGMFIGARDHARFGLLVARGGAWHKQRLIPSAWLEAMLTPSATNPGYGYLWWLNRTATRHPSVPASSVFALGAGSNIIWIDPEHDLVVVLRWIDKAAVDGFLARLLAAING
ncbi:MAG TPA: serine hydrolase [Hyphomicrobiaceae bacterium]|nr:serine hydrolase [Hyphomicrobiaceae bacterium]